MLAQLPRRFATRGNRIAAATRARFAPNAHFPQMRKKAGFFRVCFAQGANYASFGAWKSSFAKLAASRVVPSLDACCDLRARARSS